VMPRLGAIVVWCENMKLWSYGVLCNLELFHQIISVPNYLIRPLILHQIWGTHMCLVSPRVS
jgi:hypothetical protein